MDKIEKEINELLEQIDQFPGENKAGQTVTQRKAKPASLSAHRRKRRLSRLNPLSAAGALIDSVSPPTLMLTGAGLVIGGMLLAVISGFFIWLSFVGIVIFFLAFAASFRKTPKPTADAGSGSRTVFWRDRYIEYDPAQPGVSDRVKRMFRRR